MVKCNKCKRPDYCEQECDHCGECIVDNTPNDYFCSKACHWAYRNEEDWIDY